MEFRSVTWTILNLLWSVHSLNLEPLGHYIEGLYPAHDELHPIGASSSRHVREVARSHRHHSRGGFMPFKYCCGGENNTEHKSGIEHREELDRCIQELDKEDEWTLYGNPTKDPFTCEAIKKIKNHFNCFINCMMRVRGVLRDDGSEDIEKWEDLTTNSIAFPWLKDLALTAFYKCVANKDYSWLKNEDTLKCNPRVINVNHCVWREIITTCPEEHYVKNAYCKRVKKAFEEVDG
nr:odorant binding protein 2 [Graphosoma rubrolineatum]